MFDFLKRFIDRLAEVNKEEFKGEKPDCCTINRPEQCSPITRENK